MSVVYFRDIEFLRVLFLQFGHLRLISFAACFQYRFDLGHGNNREVLGEQKEAGKEQTERTEVKTDLPDRGTVISTPGRRQEVAVHRGHDDHETFEPHSDVHDDTHKESNRDVPPEFAAPEQLRRDHVTEHHQPVAPAIGAEKVGPVLFESEPLVLVLAVPGNEQLGQVGATYDAARKNDHFVHRFDVADGDIILQVQYFTYHDHQGLHHGKPGEDRTGNEIRREDGGMPSRHYRGGEVE